MERRLTPARLDEFSRRWPLAACLVGFGYVVARGLIDGNTPAAVVFGLLGLGVLVALVRVVAPVNGRAEERRSPGSDR